MRFAVLGPLSIEVDGIERPVASNRERVLLAMLVLGANQVVPMHTLVDAVWGDSPPPTARAQIHSCVSRLRRMLGDDTRVHTDPAGYLLRAAPDEVDVFAFDAMVAAGRAAAEGGRLTEASE